MFVAGGIGITVFRSMLRYIADKGEPYRVTLVYSNRDRASTPFLDELQELEQAIPGFRLVLTMTEDEGWEGESRYVSAELLRDHLEGELADQTYLVAGPPAMVESRRRAAERRGRAGGAGAPRPASAATEPRSAAGRGRARTARARRGWRARASA